MSMCVNVCSHRMLGSPYLGIPLMRTLRQKGGQTNEDFVASSQAPGGGCGQPQRLLEAKLLNSMLLRMEVQAGAAWLRYPFSQTACTSMRTSVQLVHILCGPM